MLISEFTIVEWVFCILISVSLLVWPEWPVVEYTVSPGGWGGLIRQGFLPALGAVF